MRIIGVIDAMRGRAVHGRGGRRELYRRVSAAAGTFIGGDPGALASAYLERTGLRELYLADLDAIQGGTPQDDLVQALASRGARLLVDAGITSCDQARRSQAAGADVIVVGLETLTSFDALSDMRSAIPDRGLAFSLDLRDGVPMSERLDRSGLTPAELACAAADAGADTVIVLDVARVGSSQGLDLAMMGVIRAAVPGVALLAGGGVRGPDDLRQLADAGCDGALVATALHTGALTAEGVAIARAL